MRLREMKTDRKNKGQRPMRLREMKTERKNKG